MLTKTRIIHRLHGFYKEGRLLVAPNSAFSVQPLCPLCLRGYLMWRKRNHRDTEDTEVAQRRICLGDSGPVSTAEPAANRVEHDDSRGKHDDCREAGVD